MRRDPQPAHDDADAVALARVARGDIMALGTLYDRHQRAVLRFAQRVTRRASDAEDIVQETFLAAARRADSFDGRDSCRAWLVGIAAHLVMHRNRAAGRLLALGRRLTDASSLSPTSLDAGSRHEARSEVDDALRRLSPEKRVVIVMAEVEGMTGDEIARALAIPAGTVATRLHHARRELATRLQKREP